MTIRDDILAHLKSRRYAPVKTRGLARFFDVQEDEYAEFRSLIKEMIAEGDIVEGSGGKLLPPKPEAEAPAGSFTGRLHLSPKGFGFIAPDDPKMSDDVFVPPGDTLDAITGDQVLAVRVRRKFAKPGQLDYVARVIKVVARGQKRFVGTYRVRGKTGAIKPDGGVLLTEEIPVADASSSGARPNDKVVFELLTYPAMNQRAEAVIVEVLGPRGAPGVDTLAVIRQFDLPDEFPEAVLNEARAAADRFTDEEIARRTDLRGLLVVTIDPEDARDYDDAISIEPLDGDLMRLGVHIADVSFFVRPGSPLDTEAATRGTSVYLPTMVLPMLPELLSNGICSLQEGKDRLVKSAFIDLDAAAKVRRVSFANGVIRNRKRLTYEQVNEVLEKGRRDLVEPEVLTLLENMDKLARRILDRRRRWGYLELELPAVDLEFDENGSVVDAHPEDDSFSHKIIEMFMVEANEAVARHLAKRGAPFIRRAHAEPEGDRLETMHRFLKSCGYNIKNPRSRQELQRLLEETRQSTAAYPVHVAVLRSMMRAEYAVSDEGHWALASECYSHFTSPIRRYPDLTVHRTLADVEGWTDSRTGERPARRGRRAKATVDGEAALKETASRCSQTERRAEAAERELTKVKVLTLLEKHVGEVFDGVVSATADYGLFIEMPKYLVEGLLHTRDLLNDSYELDRRSFALKGRRHGQVIRVGDPIRVTIASVDIPRRELNLAPAPDTDLAKAGAKTAGRGADKPRSDRRGKSSRTQQTQRNQRGGRGKSGRRRNR
ncbi:MAG: ribonuclease R [Planctomycetes bacterium]|nr:ribonuclease R [Planctomycetota bacterium]